MGDKEEFIIGVRPCVTGEAAGAAGVGCCLCI